jgi:hypothetical protein
MILALKPGAVNIVARGEVTESHMDGHRDRAQSEGRLIPCLLTRIQTWGQAAPPDLGAWHESSDGVLNHLLDRARRVKRRAGRSLTASTRPSVGRYLPSG